MRALCIYYATLGTTAVGTLTNCTVGGQTQYTSASGLYMNPPIVSVTLIAGSYVYNLTAMI